MPFWDDLRQFGPDATYRITLDEARAYCAGLAASHYENFHVVTWLTPPPLRPAFQSIYAFCRWSDDLGDEVTDPSRAQALLGWWRGELHALFDGEAHHPVMLALAETVREFAIPIAPFEALISAFEQDQVINDYDTYERLLDYCTRSANPVGHLVLYLARFYDAENARLSDATCTALQLTNFWQDVSRDLDIGRTYLPREDRARFGVADSDLAARRFTPEFAALLQFEVNRTRQLFEVGLPLISRMPRALAVDVDLFSRGGLAILNRIETQGFDVFAARPKLGKLTKLALLARAFLGQLRSPGIRGKTDPPRARERIEARTIYSGLLASRAQGSGNTPPNPPSEEGGNGGMPDAFSFSPPFGGGAGGGVLECAQDDRKPL